MRWLKRLAVLLLVVALAVAAGGWWWKSRNGPGSGEGELVRVEPAARGVLVEVISAPGTVKPKTEVQVTSRVAARIKTLPFTEGATIRKDQVLVELDAKDLEAQLASVEARHAAGQAELAVAEARLAAQPAQVRVQEVQLADARRALKRMKDLFETEDASQAQLEEAQAKVDQLQAQLDALRQTQRADQANLDVLRHQLRAAAAEIARVKDDLSYTVVRSTIDGVVTKLNREVGELVVPVTTSAAGMAIMELADLSVMMVEARVDETAVGRLAKGQKAIVRMNAYEGELFEGVVDTVPLAATEDRDGSKHYKTEVLLKLPPGRVIQSGLTADVDIETRRHAGAIRVPTQAVLGRAVDDLPAAVRELPEVRKAKTITPVVYLMKDGKALVRPVAIGPSDVTHTLILSGIEEGDPVITGPYKVLESLKHDQKVRRDMPAPGAPPATNPATAPATAPAAAAASAATRPTTAPSAPEP